MSVIFKTLEKVRRSSLGQEKKGGKPKRSRNIYSFRRIVISPLGVLCLAFLLILLALFSGYGEGLLGDYFSGNNKQHVTRKAKPILHAAIDVRSQDQALREREASPEAPLLGHENTCEETLPEPPVDIPVEDVKPGGQYLPPADLKKTPSSAASSPKYSPPESQTGLGKSSGEIERTMGRVALSKEQVLSGDEPPGGALGPAAGNSPKDGTKLPTEGVLSHGTPPSDNVRISYVPPAGEQKMKTDDGKGSTEQRTMTFEPGEILSVAPDVGRDADMTDLVSPQEERVPVLSARLHRDGLSVSGPITEKRFSSRHGRDPRAERIYQVNLEKAAEVGRMVSKIEESMTEGDMDHAKVLIDHLADLKGEESPYLLKLRAVWHMRQRDYASAASLLTKVLEKEEDDLEAGINMAIIEIKTHRLDEARKRLAGLREIYQANTLIPELIRETGG
jgi:hypothetical protein